MYQVYGVPFLFVALQLFLSCPSRRFQSRQTERGRDDLLEAST